MLKLRQLGLILRAVATKSEILERFVRGPLQFRNWYAVGYAFFSDPIIIDGVKPTPRVKIYYYFFINPISTCTLISSSIQLPLTLIDLRCITCPTYIYFVAYFSLLSSSLPLALSLTFSRN